MSRTWKHAETGIYCFLKRVPEELRTLLGKTEEKKSLCTRDPPKVQLEHAEVSVTVKRRQAKLKVGPHALSEREAQEYVRSAHDTLSAHYL